MKSFEMFQELFRRCSAKNIADAFGVKLQAVYKWSAQGEIRKNPVDRMLTLLRAAEDLLPLHWLCEQFGG